MEKQNRFLRAPLLLLHDRRFKPTATGIDEKGPLKIGSREGQPESGGAQQDSCNRANGMA